MTRHASAPALPATYISSGCSGSPKTAILSLGMLSSSIDVGCDSSFHVTSTATSAVLAAAAAARAAQLSFNEVVKMVEFVTDALVAKSASSGAHR